MPRRGDGLVTLWIRVEKGGGPQAWFTQDDIVGQTLLELMPVQAGLDKQECRLTGVFQRRPNGRTGSVEVAQFIV